MASFQQYTLSPWLSPVRVLADSNQVGTYFNGSINNGVGATLTLGTGVLIIDSVTINLSDRVLLKGQTNQNENGLYVCTQEGAVGVSAVLQRSGDQQCIEQYFAGQYVSISAGSVYQGSVLVLVEPIPAKLGVDPIIWTDSTSLPSNAQLKSSIIAGTTSNLGGSGVGPINTGVPQLVTGAVIVATIKSSSNPVGVASATCTSNGNLQIIFTANPGASALVNFIALTAPQNNT
jgi:hypothetical protein